MGAVGNIGTQCGGEVVKVITAIYQCSSPANTGKGACSPDPNIQSPLNVSKRSTEKEQQKSGMEID